MYNNDKEKTKLVTFPCLEGGMECGTTSGPAACEVDWNRDKYVLISMHMKKPYLVGPDKLSDPWTVLFQAY